MTKFGSLIAVLVAGALAPSTVLAGMTGPTASGYRLSEPVSHGNLAIYLVHGPSRGGAVPLTLQEALASGAVQVHETGQVNQLLVQNAGTEAVFIQAGDIVKGGQQDRVLGVSMLLPALSGPLPVTAFCVEHGRWTKRAGEDATRFASSDATMPSREGRLAIAAVAAAAPPQPESRAAPVAQAPAVASSQQKIWDSVGSMQRSLASRVGGPVAAPASPSSLPLTLENQQLAKGQDAYIRDLEAIGRAGDDVVGFAFAINGRLDGAEIYPSSALFRKLWPKLLRAAVTEAIADQGKDLSKGAAAPNADEAGRMFAVLDGAAPLESQTNILTKVRISENAEFMLVESRPASAGLEAWIHRRILAK